MSDAAATGAEDRTVPPPLARRTDRLWERLEAAPQLCCCLDFDGTLAPIVADPDAATMTAANRRALAALADDPATTVAIVSGRGLADLRSRIDLDVTLVGNHGLEIQRGNGPATHPVADARAPAVATCCAILAARLERIPGCEIEHKRLTGTVHLRTVPDQARALVERTTRAVVERIGGGELTLARGKEILEFSPAIDWGKGDAVDILAGEQPPDALTLYVGDDTTDEHAFAALPPNGVGVLVGDPRPSHASCRVDSPAAVAALLARLAARG